MFLLFIGGLLIAIVIPNITGSWPSKTGEIINNLRQIDAAKNEWAIEHGFTNYSQIVEMTNQLTKLDLIQILSRRSDKQDEIVPSIDGEIYVINPMNKSPEAKLVRKIYNYPNGSIIRFANGFANDTNKQSFEVIFPDGTKAPCY